MSKREFIENGVLELGNLVSCGHPHRGVEAHTACRLARCDGAASPLGRPPAVGAQPVQVKAAARSIRRSAASTVFPVATQPGRSGTDAPQSLPGSLSMRTRYWNFLMRVLAADLPGAAEASVPFGISSPG